MKICFVTNTVVKKDDLTTYDLAVSALSKGHEVSFMNVTDFSSRNNDVYGNVRVVKKKPESRADLVKLLEQTPQAEANLQKIDALFLRHKYRKGSKILENYHKAAREYAFHLMDDDVFVLNDPRFLPFMSSKIATLGLDKSILPEKQLVSNDFNQLMTYCKETLSYEGVLKPLFGCGGNGIYFIEKKNLRNNIKALLEEGPVIAQSYIKSEGDKRILVLG
jgi:glutathione synthase